MHRPALLIFTALLSTLALADPPELTGYIKANGSQSRAHRGTNPSNAMLGELNLNLTETFDYFHYDLALLAQDVFSTNGSAAPIHHYRLDHQTEPLKRQRYENGTNEIYLNLNRANVQYSDSRLQLDVGRQALSLGVSKIFSPLDLTNQFNLLNYDLEQRDGVDVARFRFQMTKNSLVHAGVLGKDERLSFLQWKLHRRLWDLTASFLRYEHTNIAALSLSAQMYGAGIYAELTETFDRNIQRKNYPHFTVGTDYRFASSLYVILELFYNGSGSKTSGRVEEFWFHPFKNREYVFGQLSYELTPLLIFKANEYLNVHDGSHFPIGKLEYNFLDNYYAVGGIGISSKANLANEFAAIPDFGYVALKHFF